MKQLLPKPEAAYRSLTRRGSWKVRLAVTAGVGLALAVLGQLALRGRAINSVSNQPANDPRLPSGLAGAGDMPTRYLTTQEGRIAYDDTGGTGPLVICVPGLGDVRAEYRFLTPSLKEAGYRVVTMDVRGHGETSVSWPDYSVAGVGADILALARHLNAGPVAVIGTSMAAGAGVWAAAEDPQTIRSLVLIGPFVRESGPYWKKQMISLLFTGLFSGPWGSALWGKYYTSLYPTVKPADLKEYVMRLHANLDQPGRLRALRGMVYASKDASEVRLAKVKAPVLVLMGNKDPDFSDPVAEARLVGERLNGEVQIIDGAGHYPHAEIPVRTAPFIKRFLNQVEEVKHDA